MSKKHNKDANLRNKVLVIAACVVALASIAYAAFSTTLTINGTGNISGNWDVHIKSIASDTPAFVGATDVSAPSVGTDKLSATFDVNFAYPGAVAYYDVVVENKGTINGRLVSITDLATKNAEAPADIKFTVVTAPAINDEIAPTTGTDSYRIKAEWVPGLTTNPSTLTKTATIEFGYEQYTP